MNTVKRNKKSGLIRAWSEQGEIVAIAGTVEELINKKLIYRYDVPLDKWLILPKSNPYSGILKDTELEAKEAMENL